MTGSTTKTLALSENDAEGREIPTLISCLLLGICDREFHNRDPEYAEIPDAKCRRRKLAKESHDAAFEESLANFCSSQLCFGLLAAYNHQFS